MSVLANSKVKILLLVLGFIVTWQSLKYLPWFDRLEKKPAYPKLDPSGKLKPVQVSVYYEALCPDSRNFISKQLKPVLDKIPHLLNISLIPYGKAQTHESFNGTLNFTCQHGPVECAANKVHACAVYVIFNQMILVNFISCMVKENMIPELDGEKCAKENELNWNTISQCVNSNKGNRLLKKFGEMTDALNSKMTFVPTVLLNNEHRNQAAILKDLLKEVCFMFNELPEECM